MRVWKDCAFWQAFNTKEPQPIIEALKMHPDTVQRLFGGEEHLLTFVKEYSDRYNRQEEENEIKKKALQH